MDYKVNTNIRRERGASSEAISNYWVDFVGEIKVFNKDEEIYAKRSVGRKWVEYSNVAVKGNTLNYEVEIIDVYFSAKYRYQVDLTGKELVVPEVLYYKE